jgi:MFS family permease
VRQLFAVSPTGVVGYFGTMLANSAYFGVGAVYGREIGLSVRDMSLFMSLIMVGGMLLQWPIGRLSDAWDRRQVLTAVTFLAAVFALLASVAAERSLVALFARKGESGRSWVRSDSLPVRFVRLPGRSALPHHKGWCAILAGIRISPDEFLRLLQSQCPATRAGFARADGRRNARNPAGLGFVRFCCRSGSFGCAGRSSPGSPGSSSDLGIMSYLYRCDHRNLIPADLARCRRCGSEQTRWAVFPGVRS